MTAPPEAPTMADVINRLQDLEVEVVELRGRVAALEAKIERDEDYAREQNERGPA